MNRLIVVLLLLGVAACSTPVTLGSGYGETERKMVTPKFSELIFYTPAYLGRKTYYQVSVDGKAVGPLGGKSFFAHASKPGSVTVSAKKVNAGETAAIATLTVLSMGAFYMDTRKSRRNRANPVPLDVVVEEGATRYLRVREKAVSFLVECEKSGDEARLCKAGRIDLSFEIVPEDDAKQELSKLRESLS